MEGKVVTMSVVLLVSFLVLGQIQVEAQQLRSCCPSTSARNIYNTCRFAGGSQSLCASTSGCRRLNTCPAGWQHDILENTPGKFAYTMEDNAVSTSCCPNATARRIFDVCRALPPRCATLSGCVLVPGRMACPPHFPYNMLQNTVDEYCKLGCVSSVCAAITTLQDSDVSEVVNGAVEKCGNACSDFCTNNKAASVITTVVPTTAAA